MKCKECECCKKGWFESKPEDYVCIGVKHPFVISNINHECTEYDELRDKKFPAEDLFVISFDNANNGDCAALCVKRIRGNNAEIINVFYNEDAFKKYSELVNWT